MSFRIEVLERSDLDQVFDLMNAVAAECDNRFYYTGPMSFFEERLESGVIIGAYDNDTMVGYAILDFPSTESKENAYYGIAPEEYISIAMLEDCAILPIARGKGLQLDFIKYRENLAKEMRYKHLCTCAHPENVYSCGNLLKAGLVVVNESDDAGLLVSPCRFFYKSLQ